MRLIHLLMLLLLTGCNPSNQTDQSNAESDVNSDNSGGQTNQPNQGSMNGLSGFISGQTGDVKLVLSLDTINVELLNVSAQDNQIQFNFIPQIGQNYDVTVVESPSDQQCSVSLQSSGEYNEPVVDITVVCNEQTSNSGLNSCNVYDSDAASVEHQQCIEWLTLHNQTRDQLNQGLLPSSPQPETPIEMMTWSSKLALVASQYANQCQFLHNGDRRAHYNAVDGADDNEGDSIGENLSIIGSTAIEGFTAEDLYDGWANEEAFYNSQTGGSTDVNEQVGHYTQIIWRGSLEVGCAISTCEQGEIYADFPTKLAVCNYSPAGNYVGQLPY